MADYIESLQTLADKFGSLPGIGKKSALRMAYSVLELSDEEAADFARAITDAKEKIHLCPICQNLTDRDVCSICDDLGRDRSVICVVEDARDVISIEKVREYRGLYHVLHGVISPMNNITPDKIKIAELLARLSDNEVKIADSWNYGNDGWEDAERFENVYDEIGRFSLVLMGTENLVTGDS